MSAKIIINSDEFVVCPKCEHKFHFHQGIARHTVEKYEEGGGSYLSYVRDYGV